MNVQADLAPWQQRVWDQAIAAIDAGRLAHGLLFCGPQDLGKRALAERLAQRLLCEEADIVPSPCGRCRACRLFAAGTHPDYRLVSLVPNKEGTRLRSEIVIEQIRELTQALGLTAQYGRAQVVLIDPADAINHAAANALLKTLEEPRPGRYLWLLSTHPARLPATVRSRCQQLELRLPSRGEALDWMRQRGHQVTAASEALDAARGHPGLAEHWLREGRLQLRREVMSDLSALADGTSAAGEVAQRWSEDEHLDLRLRFAADLALDLAAGRAVGLTICSQTRRLAAWFDQANRAREWLHTAVRADLAVLELLSAWPAIQIHAHSSGAMPMCDRLDG